MSPQDSAPKADQAKQPEAKPAEVQFAERILGREFTSVEEAEKSIKNLNSLVGDQSISKQRQALEKIAKQANLSTEELIQVIETQDIAPQPVEETPEPVVRNLPDDQTKRLVRLETDTFIKDNPEAKVIRDQLFAEALKTGKPVEEVWSSTYAPIIEAGKKIGAKKLQSTLEGQPTRATSTASDTDDTKVDFSKMSSKDMEKFMGHVPPSRQL